MMRGDQKFVLRDQCRGPPWGRCRTRLEAGPSGPGMICPAGSLLGPAWREVNAVRSDGGRPWPGHRRPSLGGQAPSSCSPLSGVRFSDGVFTVRKVRLDHGTRPGRGKFQTDGAQVEGADGPVGSRPATDPRLSLPSAVLGILWDVRKRAAAGDAAVYSTRAYVR